MEDKNHIKFRLIPLVEKLEDVGYHSGFQNGSVNNFPSVIKPLSGVSAQTLHRIIFLDPLKCGRPHEFSFVSELKQPTPAAGGNILLNKLLDGIVQRHERAVQTQRLQRIVDVSGADVATFDEGMKISSRWLTGHTAPISDGTQIIPHDQMTAEMKKFTGFRDGVLKRRKGK